MKTVGKIRALCLIVLVGLLSAVPTIAEDVADVAPATAAPPSMGATPDDTTGATQAAAGVEQAVGELHAETAAQAVIAGLNASLLDVLKQSEDLDYAGRYALLQPCLGERFDLQYMARQSVGRSFLDLDEEDRQIWYKMFANYMTANYAARFDHYSEQRFEILGEEAGARDTVLVRTQVIDPADKNFDLSYRLRETPAGWKVVDVYLKGTISELALRRSEYSTVLKRDGFEALVASVTATIAELEAGSEK